MKARHLLLPAVLASALACAAPEPVPSGPVCDEPTAPPCQEELRAGFSLVEGEPSPQTITNDYDEGAGLKSVVDARAGGLAADPRQSYLYARFTEGGLEKVSLDDVEALSSMEWDIAFHRYIVRLNGGSSGPSCVSATALPDVGYDELKEPPAAEAFVTDELFTGQCQLRSEVEAQDPANERDYGAALRGYYGYVGCLQMTGTPFVVRLADGRQLKLLFTHFYGDEAQRQCDETGESTHAGAGLLQLRWAFLEDT